MATFINILFNLSKKIVYYIQNLMIFKVILSHDYLICVTFYIHCIFNKHPNSHEGHFKPMCSS